VWIGYPHIATPTLDLTDEQDLEIVDVGSEPDLEVDLLTSDIEADFDLPTMGLSASAADILDTDWRHTRHRHCRPMTGPTNTGSGNIGFFILQTLVSWQFYVILYQNAATCYSVTRQERFVNIF